MTVFIQLGDRIIEIICINDGSLDNSEKIVSHYMLKDSRIQLINQENSGISCVRNAGISSASGNYLMFVDGNDYILPQKLEKLLDEIEVNGNPDAVCMW